MLERVREYRSAIEEEARGGPLASHLGVAAAARVVWNIAVRLAVADGFTDGPLVLALRRLACAMVLAEYAASPDVVLLGLRLFTKLASELRAAGDADAAAAAGGRADGFAKVYGESFARVLPQQGTDHTEYAGLRFDRVLVRLQDALEDGAAAAAAGALAELRAAADGAAVGDDHRAVAAAVCYNHGAQRCDGGAHSDALLWAQAAQALLRDGGEPAMRGQLLRLQAYAHFQMRQYHQARQAAAAARELGADATLDVLQLRILAAEGADFEVAAHWFDMVDGARTTADSLAACGDALASCGLQVDYVRGLQRFAARSDRTLAARNAARAVLLRHYTRDPAAEVFALAPAVFEDVLAAVAGGDGAGDARVGVQQLAWEAAVQLVELRRYGEAADWVHRCARAADAADAPAQASCERMHSHCCVQLDDSDGAIAHAERAASLDPVAESLLQLAIAAVCSGDEARALDALERLQRAPGWDPLFLDYVVHEAWARGRDAVLASALQALLCSGAGADAGKLLASFLQVLDRLTERGTASAVDAAVRIKETCRAAMDRDRPVTVATVAERDYICGRVWRTAAAAAAAGALDLAAQLFRAAGALMEHTAVGGGEPDGERSHFLAACRAAATCAEVDRQRGQRDEALAQVAHEARETLRAAERLDAAARGRLVRRSGAEILASAQQAAVQACALLDEGSLDSTLQQMLAATPRDARVAQLQQLAAFCGNVPELRSRAAELLGRALETALSAVDGPPRITAAAALLREVVAASGVREGVWNALQRVHRVAATADAASAAAAADDLHWVLAEAWNHGAARYRAGDHAAAERWLAAALQLAPAAQLGLVKIAMLQESYARVLQNSQNNRA
jgi:hypothetical protein